MKNEQNEDAFMLTEDLPYNYVKLGHMEISMIV